jgi:hypothetical protein
MTKWEELALRDPATYAALQELSEAAKRGGDRVTLFSIANYLKGIESTPKPKREWIGSAYRR